MDRVDEERKRHGDPLELSADIRYLEEIMARMMRQAFRGIEEPLVRRKRVKDLLGKYNNRRFHNRVSFVKKESNRKPVVKKIRGRRSKSPDRDQLSRDPLVDIVEEDDHLLVVAHLPGAKKQDMNVRLRKRRLIISVNTPSRKYHKKVELPTKVEKKNYPATYKNGVLRIRLQKD